MDEITQEQRNNAIRNRIRIDRNKCLAESDWTQMPDNSLTEEQRNEWLEYRQQLRDLPSRVKIESSYVKTINAMTWPVPPSGL